MALSLGYLAVAIFAAYALAASAIRTGKRYVVGGDDGWHVPARGSQDMYMKWASGVTFYVQDAIEFVYKNDSVIKVHKFGYYHCNETLAVGAEPKDGSTLFLLDTPGYVYFSSNNVGHCKKGQRLMINVEAASTPTAAPSLAPAPSPSSTETAAAASSLPALFVHALAPVTLVLVALVRT